MSTESSGDSKVDGEEGQPSSSTDQMRRQLAEEFNVQRAKMKELFLQKEEDMRKMVQEKEQLESEVLGLRAELQQLDTLSQNQKSEIQSLQLLVNETVEASSSGNDELRRVMARNQELEQQLNLLRQQQQEVSLAPATFVRSLARKLGAESDQDNNTKKAQNVEENELLQSIIQPLNDEIVVLKGKLRDTDTQLQEALKSKSSATASPAIKATSGENRTEPAESEPAAPCAMCANYEKQLVAEQAHAAAERERAQRLHAAANLAAEELEGVRSLHDETVRTWQAERSAARASLDELAAGVSEAQRALQQRAAAAQQAEQRALHLVTTLTVDRETLQRTLDSLEKDNAYLVGEYSKKAAEMQNEVIDLPDNVEELQELTLRLREQVIVSAVGRERAVDSEAELRRQLLQHTRLLHQHDAALAAARTELEQLQTERSQMKELGDKLRQSNDLIERLLEDKKRLNGEAAELRVRVGSLQQELDNSEKVQQDFVRLSQSLQVQLQRIRESEGEVRWQHEEDVSSCPACGAALPSARKKVHCRHCGRIYCGPCASHEVPCGPRGAAARVCAVCRTLLQPHAPPYFSTRPPR